MAAEPLATEPAAAAGPTDPYVIYQLRKPSQRGTAVIPRFVPNTHAPAFSPANYRFARVWAAADPTNASPASLLHVPRSFEYAGSLGSESSFWSDTSSWLSVSSLRTAASDARAPLLHAAPAPVSAASFFNNDFAADNTLSSSLRAPGSARSSDLDSPVRPDFRYPPALSESVSEDAVVDDLLAMRAPHFPLRDETSPSHSKPHTPTRLTPNRPSPVSNRTSPTRNPTPTATPPKSTAQSTRPHQTHPANAPRPNPTAQAPPRTAAPSKAPPSRPALLPALTRKRRSLWQWLFCSDTAAASTTVPSVHAPAPTRDAAPSSKARASPAASLDRVPRADKDFLHRAHRAPDAPAPQRKRSSNRRSPSFEIRLGRPDHSRGESRRSVSWSLMSKAFLNRGEPKKKNRSAPPAKQNAPPQTAATAARKKKKPKDRPRGIVPDEEDEGSKGHRFAFQKPSSRRQAPPSSSRKEAERVKRKATVPPREKPVSRRERPQDRPREDRPRGDRPRQGGPGQMKDSSSVAPVQTSVVPSLREKKGGSSSSHSQRMRSGESSDQVASRISSDLSSTTMDRTTGSGSGHSTPLLSRGKYHSDSHDLDPAANGVSSDVSSHASGVQGKASPLTQKTDPGSNGQSGLSSSNDFEYINERRATRSSPFRSELFAFPSTSSESGGFLNPNNKREWDGIPGVYPEYTNTPMQGESDGTDDSALLADPVAQALEKNRARSAGGPLSYLMKQHDADIDVNTQSTGLTSLADESVSTHKTVSAVGEEFKMPPQTLGLSRYPYRESKKGPRPLQEVHDSGMSDGSGAGRPIFKNSALFNHSGGMSPSQVSNSSPRRFHSDWSDPHATDIDVYCQCSCSCVYEEECRRTCELVYGRSPSVSSTRSCSRRGYPGFQTLPPAMDATYAGHPILPSGIIETSDEPLAFIGNLNPAARPGRESRGNAQKSIIRASAVDELPDPRVMETNGMMESEMYESSAADYRMLDVGSTRGYEHVQTSHRSSQHNGLPGRYRHGEDGRRSEPMEVRTGHTQHRTMPHETRGSSPKTHGKDKTKQSRRGEASPRYRSPQNEGNTMTREQKGRPSSRRTNGTSSSSRQSSGMSRRNDTPRSGEKDEGAEMMTVERRRREAEERKKYGSRTQAEGTQQMGNSYVVKRNGLPPFGQTNTPPPYRASGYGRDVSYDYNDHEGTSGERGRSREGGPSGWEDGVDLSGVGIGPAPVVELEFETGSIGSPDTHRHNGMGSSDGGYPGRGQNTDSREQKRGAESGQHGGRKGGSGNQHHSRSPKGEVRPSSKQARPTARQNPKSNNRHRTPLFNLF